MQEVVAEAAETLRAETGFEAGAEVKTDRLLQLLGLDVLPERKEGESNRAYVRRCKRLDMASIGPVKALRERLLHVFNVDLQATRRGFYRIVPPGQQAPRAERDAIRGARKALKEGLDRIKHTAVEKLDAHALKRHEASLLNTATRLSMLSSKSPAAVLDEVRAKAETPSVDTGAPVEARD